MRAMVACVFLLILTPLNSHGQPTPKERHGRVFGTFSSLYFNEEGGDLLGRELTIVPQYETAYAIFQCAEGTPFPPVFVPVQIVGDLIRFKISDSVGCDGEYVGTISNAGLELKHGESGTIVSETLARKKSYWSQ